MPSRVWRRNSSSEVPVGGELLEQGEPLRARLALQAVEQARGGEVDRLLVAGLRGVGHVAGG